MTPMELIRILDSGMVEELTMYYNGSHTVVNIRNLPEIMPDYEINKLWNSEDGKGISVLLADNMRQTINNDLISREALKKAIDDAYEEYDGYDPHDLCRFAERVDEEIDNAPTVTPCDNCIELECENHGVVCPHYCGAKMDGGEEE